MISLITIAYRPLLVGSVFGVRSYQNEVGITLQCRHVFTLNVFTIVRIIKTSILLALKAVSVASASNDMTLVHFSILGTKTCRF
jgi:hypothetical protein